MRLPRPFRKQDKQEAISYSAVDGHADIHKPATGVRAQVIPPLTWPADAGLIARARMWIAVDCVLLLLPIAFIALAIIAVELDGKEISPYGNHVRDAILLGPTIYPLVFAALGGRALRKIALWRASEGTTLGFLEHVLGSQSLAATIGHAFTVHTVDVLALALLAFWSLSPLGGQSVLRLLHETNRTITDTRPVFYPKVDAVSLFSSTLDDAVDVCNRANAVVSSALLSTETMEWTPVDAWSHPKIPRIDELENEASKNTTDRSWYTVDPNSNYSYASLAGVNIVNLSKQGSTNLTIPYEYMYFDCKMSPMTDFNNSWLPDRHVLGDYLSELKNQSRLKTDGWDGSKNKTSGLFIDNSFFMYAKGTYRGVESLLYGSRYTGSANFFLWECSMHSVMVEAKIVCHSDKCGVDRLKRIDRPMVYHDAGTPFDMVHSWLTAPYFIQALALLGGKTSISVPNIVDAYIFGNSPWNQKPKDRGFLLQNWTDYVTEPQKPKEMSRRLTKVLNTYLDSSRWAKAVTLTDPFGKTSLNSTGQPIDALTMDETGAIVFSSIPVYKLDAPWAALSLVCSAALLLLSMFGVFVQCRTVAPDILNYISSLTRDNPHIDAPVGGSRLGGAERARLLKNMRVQLGDAEPQSKTGYVVFRSTNGSDDVREGRLRSDRMYR